jgi:hypothetical protein
MVKNSKTASRGRGSRRGRTYRQRGGNTAIKKARDFINVFDQHNLKPVRRAAFTRQFRELGSDENAFNTIMSDEKFIKYLNEDENAVKANTPYSSPQYNDLSSALQHYSVGENTRPVSANTPSSYDNYTSSLLQHYGLE